MKEFHWRNCFKWKCHVKLLNNFILKIIFLEELKEELRDWNEKFPNLSIHGKSIGESPELEERKQLRQIIGRRIVEMHLWPEANSLKMIKLIIFDFSDSHGAFNKKDKNAKKGWKRIVKYAGSG
jgi:hypothetical protein